MEALDYNREAAERFGWDAQINCICAGKPECPDLSYIFIERAERNARIAFHFAARVSLPESGGCTVHSHAYGEPCDAACRDYPLDAIDAPEFCNYCAFARGFTVKLDVLGACPCCARLGTEVR